MTEHLAALSRASQPDGAEGDPPPTEVVAFIRFCHRRRRTGWPELYDEMCAVAARREFKGWGHDQLAERGVTFTLLDMPRLAAWVRAVVAAPAAVSDGVPEHGAAATRHEARVATA
jgi:hypothetical protein